MLNESIARLVDYGIRRGLTPACEKIYTTNLLLEVFGEDDYQEPEGPLEEQPLEEILKSLLDEAVSRGIIEDSIVFRDLLDTKIMNCLLPRPTQVQQAFQEQYALSPITATEYFYKFSQDSDYIRRYRIAKDMR